MAGGQYPDGARAGDGGSAERGAGRPARRARALPRRRARATHRADHELHRVHT